MTDHPLAGFNNIGQRISLYRPQTLSPNVSSNRTTSEPRLIILCSWVGAASKHIAKYTDGYKRLFPDASILLIRSAVFDMIRRSDISPACAIILAAQSDRTASTSEEHGGIVIHAFSNGGAYKVVCLAEKFAEQGGQLPVNAIILDCCPGRAEVSAVARAITLSLPNQYLARSFGAYIVYALVVLFMLFVRVLRLEDTVSIIRRNLNHPQLFSPTVPRLYLYSKKDSMIRPEDVQEHAKDAKQSGFDPVWQEIFQRATHCALLQEDSNRYWIFIQGLIESRLGYGTTRRK